ncbi:MAG: helix-turn-helix transcriptional regulator [Oscillospiraceae bacterium]|nr:helix-turn-helix transcriptional regulator [Oscillospiraceae bacterium]MBQ7816965.1 helix-turn-helix transcriptional regulator [Oscillospiraceae bacterium]
MFGDIIKKLRETNNISQKQLAQILNVSTSAVGKWEGKGNVIPSAEFLIEIADYFNVSVDFLLRGTSQNNEKLSAIDFEFISLFSQLSDAEQKIVLAEIKGILSERQAKIY